MGIDSSEIYVKATEDLGGGMTATVNMGAYGWDRSHESGTATGVYGGDATIAIATKDYKLTLGTTKGGDYLSGGISGVAGLGMDGKILTARTLNDYVALDLPLTANWTLGLNLKEASTGIGENAGFAGESSVTGQRTVSVAGTYVGGPLVANVNYIGYDSKTGVAANKDNVVRGAASYDLGVAKLGAGYAQTQLVGGTYIKDSLLGVTVPMGNFAYRAQMVQRNTDGVGAVNGTGLGVSYSLSKRTTLIANYKRWDVAAQSTANTDTWVAINHGF